MADSAHLPWWFWLLYVLGVVAFTAGIAVAASYIFPYCRAALRSRRQRRQERGSALCVVKFSRLVLTGRQTKRKDLSSRETARPVPIPTSFNLYHRRSLGIAISQSASPTRSPLPTLPFIRRCTTPYEARSSTLGQPAGFQLTAESYERLQ